LGNATTIWQNKEVQMGMIAVLHTWGQQLSLHPHLHCIVPGGGVDKEEQWKNSRSNGKFLFQVKALSKVLERSLRKLKAKEPIKYEQIRQDLWKKPWFFAKNHLETQSLWWNIWVTPIK
jgi:hypothetical protein